MTDLHGQVALVIVVANAGVDEPGSVIIDVTEADYDRMYAVNAKGAFFTLQQAARSAYDSDGRVSRPLESPWGTRGP